MILVQKNIEFQLIAILVIYSGDKPTCRQQNRTIQTGLRSFGRKLFVAFIILLQQHVLMKGRSEGI